MVSEFLLTIFPLSVSIVPKDDTTSIGAN